MRVLCSLICACLVVGCEAHDLPAIQTAQRASIPFCSQVDGKTEETLRPQAISFFLQEVGIDVKKLTVARGSRCEGKVIFAMMVDEDLEPFLVSIDPTNAEKKLIRPM